MEDIQGTDGGSEGRCCWVFNLLQVVETAFLVPMTDLCWTCQRNSTALSRSVNTPLAEKSATLKAYTEHLEEVHKERSLYKTVCDQCRETIRSEYTQAGTFTPPPLFARIEPNSVDIESHYSFDYAQQVSICGR